GRRGGGGRGGGGWGGEADGGRRALVAGGAARAARRGFGPLTRRERAAPAGAAVGRILDRAARLRRRHSQRTVAGDVIGARAAGVVGQRQRQSRRRRGVDLLRRDRVDRPGW